MYRAQTLAMMAVAVLASDTIARTAWSEGLPDAFSEAATLADPDGPGPLFGWSVAVDGNTAVVGDREVAAGGGFGIGAVYVYVRSGTVWSHQQTLRIPSADIPTNEQFGWDVAIDGDTLVAGTNDTQGQLPAGRAYVFVRSGSVWAQQEILAPPDPTDNSFGSYVAISGETIIASGFGDDVPAGIGAGSAWVFVRSAGAWMLEAHLSAPDGEAQANFGRAVAIDGDTAVIGAHRDDNGALNAGAAYVFVRSRRTWSLEQKIGADVPEASAQFGGSVDVDCDRVIVGNLRDAPTSPPGAAFVFVRSAGVWSMQQQLVTIAAQAADAFGWSVAIEGDHAVVGAYLADAGAVNGGRASIFTLDSDTWVESGMLTPSMPIANSGFAFDVAIGGDVAVIGRSYLNGSTPAFVSYLHDPADVNGDGSIDGADLGVLLSSWGLCGPADGPDGCLGDVNGSGTVDGTDLGVVLGGWQ